LRLPFAYLESTHQLTIVEANMVPLELIVTATVLFFFLERMIPGRQLPEAPGWYARAAFLNLCQVGIVVVAGIAWNHSEQRWSMFHISSAMSAPAQGFLAWFVGTFFFYWWHRARHNSGFLWRVFHQIHHSPSRIEMLTSFYKHPLEIAADSLLSSAILFVFLGASFQAGEWFNVFAVLGEYFYHSNLRTPHWVGYFLQRPEHHSVHHELDIHSFNYGDITWWDRLFGTFRETDKFAAQCGFPRGHENRLASMLRFRDSY
jgi:sterol desaturase/sphingolipid hydroxylase (fatty acid hydroxylase superfamily)